MIFSVIKKDPKIGVIPNLRAFSYIFTLIRFSLMATHTKEQLDYALETIHKVFKSHGLVD